MLKFGTSNIGKVFAGTSAVAGVYSGNDLIWTNVTSTDTVFNVSRMTSDVYEGSSTYSNCTFIAFTVTPFDNQTGEVEYDGVVKTITSASTNVIFGQYGSGADDGTAQTGNITFRNIKEIAAMSFSNSKSGTKTSQCINSIVDWGNLEIIGDNLFTSTTLTSLTLGNKIKTVRMSAFKGAGSLTSLTISSSVQDLGYSSSIITTSYNILSTNFPFENCSPEFIVSGGNQYFSSENGDLYSKDKTILYKVNRYVTSPYTVRSSVTFVQSGAMANSTISTINLNNTTKINNCAFSSGAIASAKTINGISNLTQIGGGAFHSTKVGSVTLSSNLSIIGSNVFSGSALTSITFNGYKGSQTFNSSVLPFASIGTEETGCVVTCNANIPDYFFASSSLTSSLKISNLTLNNVTSIGDYAFNYVKFLATNMTIGDSALTWIGESAFRNGTVTDSSGTAATNYIMTIGPIMSLGDYAFETFHTGTVKFTTEDEAPATDDYTTIFGAISSLGPDFEILVPDQFYDQYYYAWEDFQPYITAWV